MVYVGGLLGVSARVTLRLEDEEADVELSGVVLGGTLRGTARLSGGPGDSRVEMDEGLARALRRRRCAVVSVQPHVTLESIRVKLKLPVFGEKHLKMLRVF